MFAKLLNSIMGGGEPTQVPKPNPAPQAQTSKVLETNTNTEERPATDLAAQREAVKTKNDQTAQDLAKTEAKPAEVKAETTPVEVLPTVANQAQGLETLLQSVLSSPEKINSLKKGLISFADKIMKPEIAKGIKEVLNSIPLTNLAPTQIEAKP